MTEKWVWHQECPPSSERCLNFSVIDSYLATGPLHCSFKLIPLVMNLECDSVNQPPTLLLASGLHQDPSKTVDHEELMKRDETTLTLANSQSRVCAFGHVLRMPTEQLKRSVGQ